MGQIRFDDGFWHQPSPGAALPVGRNQQLLVESYLDGDGEPPICLQSAAVDAAPFSPLAADPDPETLLRLSALRPNDPAPSLTFNAPSERGEWVVRVALEFDTDPGPSSLETFFRLRVDVQEPVVDGKASAPVPCGTLGGEHDPPRSFLSVDGGPWIRAAGGSFSWRGTSGSGPPPNGPRVDAPHGATLRIKIEADQCANWWQIQLAPRPDEDEVYQEPFADLVPNAMRSFYDPPGEANRFRLAEIPPGDWVVRASFAFGRDSNHIIGSTSNFWNVIVPG